MRLTEPVDAPDAAGRDVPGWWTVDEPARAGRARRHGFSDQGMAHGIAGPLALLAVAQTRGITVTGQVEAIRRICRWLNACARDTGDGRWWPAYVTLSDIRESSSDERPGRPSWCYGTPGIARALQLAAIALDDPARQAEAENAVLGAASNPRQLGMLSDPYVCHGWAGLLATVSVAARDATTPALSQLIPGLVDALVAHEPVIDGPTGLVDGAAGVALTLHSVAHQAFGSWTSCLLLG